MRLIISEAINLRRSRSLHDKMADPSWTNNKDDYELLDVIGKKHHEMSQI